MTVGNKQAVERDIERAIPGVYSDLKLRSRLLDLAGQTMNLGTLLMKISGAPDKEIESLPPWPLVATYLKTNYYMTLKTVSCFVKDLSFLVAADRIIRAAHAGQQISDSELDSLIKQAKDPHWKKRYQAYEKIRHVGPRASKTIPTLIKGLADRKGYGGMVCPEALVAYGLEAIPDLMYALKDPDPEVRAEAMDVLDKLGLAAASCTEPLLQHLSQENHWRVQENILRAIESIGLGLVVRISEGLDTIWQLFLRTGDTTKDTPATHACLHIMTRLGEDGRKFFTFKLLNLLTQPDLENECTPFGCVINSPATTRVCRALGAIWLDVALASTGHTVFLQSPAKDRADFTLEISKTAQQESSTITLRTSNGSWEIS